MLYVREFDQRADGLCKGQGGSMHLIDVRLGSSSALVRSRCR
jgi:hypothetical protein